MVLQMLSVLLFRPKFSSHLDELNGCYSLASDFHVRVSIDEKTKMIQAKHFPEIIDSHHQIAHFNIDPVRHSSTLRLLIF